MTSIPARIPSWVKASAYLVPLCVLPSALWRLYIAASGPWCDPVLSTLQESQIAPVPGDRTYLVVLSLTQIGTALLTVGLVRPWGEVAPGWVPGVGGRVLPVAAVVVPAAVGCGLLFLVEGYAVLNSIFQFVPSAEAGAPCVLPASGPRATLLAWLYAPLPAWPFLLTVVTVAYHRRRTRPA